ncbi:hypothetical protein KAU34_03150 [candidate division WOR-3 bacterium]|nr:hypothetical protein [candidate division WOR-3 bacterium]
MIKEKDKKLSLFKRIVGISLIGLIPVVTFSLFWIFSQYITFPLSNGSPMPTTNSNMFFMSVIYFMIGIISFVIGIIFYIIVLSTHCFTFNFNMPFWKAFKVKLYISNIIVLFCWVIGLGFASSIVITPLLTMFGVPWIVSFYIPMLGWLIMLNLIFSFVILIWTPLDKSTITKRLLACGVSEEDINRGIFVGISDPIKSSFKKFTMVEDDVGMLWIESDKVIYKGDSDSFGFDRNKLLSIKRAVDPGSIVAYGGGVDIIIRFRQENGTERRVRLHSEGNWTIKGVARSLDRLAKRLVTWQKGN